MSRDDSVSQQTVSMDSSIDTHPPHSEHSATFISASNAGHLSADAGPSQLRDTPHLDRPVESKPRPKRRRLDAELKFSSPGPAFQDQSIDESASTQNGTAAEDGRPPRPARSRRSIGRTERGAFQEVLIPARKQDEDRPATSLPNGSPTKESGSDSVSLNSAPRQSVSSASTSAPFATATTSAKARSISVSSNNDEADGFAELPLILPSRPKPQITPAAALAGLHPFPQILAKRKDEKAAVFQSDLEDVHEHHDMLVREMFHLTKFVTLMGYDPEVASKDRSDVFTNFQQAHDLRFALDGADSAEASATGRSTRRRVNARLQSLSLSRALPPPPPPKHTDMIVTSSKRGRKSTGLVNGHSISAAEVSDVDDDGDDERSLPTLPKKGKKKPELPDDEVEADADLSLTVRPRSKGRKTKSQASLDDFIRRHMPRALPDKAPPLHVLSPYQVPIATRYRGDFKAFWQSFSLLQEDVVSATAAKEAEKAELNRYLRVDRGKSAGLAINRSIALSARQAAQQVPRKKSHHDYLLEAISASYDAVRRESRARRQLAKKVSRLVSQHWERQSGSSERDKKAEERRVRALAKWTVREVAKQWRLAVNVVRARKAAVEKAEKKKLDKQQLNAILEQSTAMLKKQHQEMARIDQESDQESEEETASTRSDYDSEALLTPDEGFDEDDASQADSLEASGPTKASADLSDGEAQAPEEVGADRLFAKTMPMLTDTEPYSLTKSSELPTQDSEASDAESPAISARPRRTIKRAAMRSHKQSGSVAPDADDVEFEAVGEETILEDEELDRQMLEEDEDDDSEDAGLAADADIPIEELLRRYKEAQEAHELEEAAAQESKAASNDAESDNNVGIESEEESEASPALPSPEDAMAVDDQSDTESAAASSRQSASRSLTRASSIMSNDRTASRSRQPFLLRGQLRPYQQIGFEWLAGLYANGVNGILADEMGLGKTIQTISVLAHLACDKGVWGPHLVIAPTSVVLNWEVEFKKFLPGFKILSYYGNQRERKEKRVGWNTENSFNVCITSYQLVLSDQHIFRRKPWVYMVLDEAHHIKNFRSQRWQTLLGFNSQRRLLLTGTPLQNNLMDLWSLMYFLMPHGDAEQQGGGAFANMKDFQDWFSNPLDKAIEGGSSMNEETRAMVTKLHTVLRPFLLRRLKSEVEKELPSKYEHVITCRLSKRQRFLYNDFMSRARTRESLESGNYLSIINCLMQLRKVCNHPDLFEVRPIVTSFAMPRSVVADFEIKELLVRRRLLREENDLSNVDLGVVNLRITDSEQHLTAIESRDLRKLNAAKKMPFFRDTIPTPPELDTWTVDGFVKTREERRQIEHMKQMKHRAYINQYRCTKKPIYGAGLISMLREAGEPKRLRPLETYENDRATFLQRCDSVLRVVKSYAMRREEMQPTIDKYAFATPRALALDLPRWALAGFEPHQCPEITEAKFDTLHPVAVKLHIAFPDASLLQYDCGKLQQLNILMRRLKEGGHRILIFTQMTRVLDILESFLNLHGYRYLRLDGATKVEQRQALTEKFNRDLRISAFILSTRSGGLGINLTGADTVLFYDLDWNAAIEAQCMDRAHRIGQTRDVHIYRFVTEHTIEENMLRKANQKRLLDNLVIQEGEFNTDALAKKIDWRDMLDEGGKLGDVEVGAAGSAVEGAPAGAREVEKAFLDAEDEEDRQAAVAARQEMFIDDSDFTEQQAPTSDSTAAVVEDVATLVPEANDAAEADDEEEDDAGTIDDYMLAFVERDWEHFA